MTQAHTFTKFGNFLIEPGKEITGELRVAGTDSELYLRDNDRFSPFAPADGCITGILNDLTKVTLLDCITLSGPGSASRGGEQYHYAKLFPHFVLTGQCHIAPNDPIVSQIRVFIEDASELFCDFDAFGTVIDSRPHIDSIATANGLDRPIPIGPEPQIVYFAGKREIVSVETVFGIVRAQHNPSWCLPSPRGVRIDNNISITVEVPEPIAFAEAIDRLLRVLRFLELVIGRPQNLQNTAVLVVEGTEQQWLKVHWSHQPSRDESRGSGRRSPQPADMLLMPIEHPEEFSRVIRFWLKNDDERQDARGRFHTSFAMQRTYTVERLVASANMFDILPKSAVPRDADLTADLLEAKTNSQKIFETLPHSYERDSVLNALGRVGKATLKHKAKHRGQIVVDAFGGRPQELFLVLDAAVDCRNHYVHGTPSKIEYSKNFDLVIFFTNTLEFVFGASELIEVGWDIRRFAERGTTMTHPYGSYLVGYKRNLEDLKSLLNV